MLFAAGAVLEDAVRALTDEMRGLRLYMELVIQRLGRRSPPRAASGAVRDDPAGGDSRGLSSVPIPGSVDFGTTPQATSDMSVATAGASDGSNAPLNTSVTAAPGEASVNSTVVSLSLGRAAPANATDLVAEARSLISQS